MPRYFAALGYVVLSLWALVVGGVPTFNRTVGEVQVGTCEGLKRNVELGLDLSVVVTADLVCSETITLSPGQDVSVASAPLQNYLILIAEDFAVPDPTDATLLVNPESAFLTLEGLVFANEAGNEGSPGAARAVWNAGTLHVYGCSFESLNYASRQDGGAVSNNTHTTAAQQHMS